MPDLEKFDERTPRSNIKTKKSAVRRTFFSTTFFQPELNSILLLGRHLLSYHYAHEVCIALEGDC